MNAAAPLNLFVIYVSDPVASRRFTQRSAWISTMNSTARGPFTSRPPCPVEQSWNCIRRANTPDRLSTPNSRPLLAKGRVTKLEQSAPGNGQSVQARAERSWTATPSNAAALCGTRRHPCREENRVFLSRAARDNRYS